MEIKKFKLLFIIGTRPEAIKMAPLILKAKEFVNAYDIKVCTTGQHRTMLDQVLGFFEIDTDFDLDLMQPGQTLTSITSGALLRLDPVLDNYKPDFVLVQGDTTTAFAGALAAFYRQVKVIHIEAGLRSGDKLSPYPEEVNRKLAGIISDIHFAPTKRAQQNLYAENIKENVFVVGNSVIDALLIGVKKIEKEQSKYEKQFDFLNPNSRKILVTGHRRESFGKPFEEICEAIRLVAYEENVEVIYPVHLNPNVQVPVKKILGDCKNVHLIDPLPYPDLIWLMNQAYIILTDSGGIQEEAPTLGKPVLVMRNVTERKEGIDAGTAKLVGNVGKNILEETRKLLQDRLEYDKMAKATNPYGDGTTSTQIFEILNIVTRNF